MNFTEYLEALVDSSQQLKIAELQRLSDPSPEQAEQFAACWPDIDVRRRRRILQELIELDRGTVSSVPTS